MLYLIRQKPLTAKLLNIEMRFIKMFSVCIVTLNLQLEKIKKPA